MTERQRVLLLLVENGLSFFSTRLGLFILSPAGDNITMEEKKKVNVKATERSEICVEGKTILETLTLQSSQQHLLFSCHLKITYHNRSCDYFGCYE